MELFHIPEKPGKYYYQCGKHKNMVGVINIVGNEL